MLECFAPSCLHCKYVWRVFFFVVFLIVFIFFSDSAFAAFLLLLCFLLLLLFCFCFSASAAFVAFLLLLLFCFCCFSAFCVFVFLLFAFVAFLLWQLFSFLFLFSICLLSNLWIWCAAGGDAAPPATTPRSTKSALHLRHPRLPRNQYFKVNSPGHKLLTNHICLLCWFSFSLLFLC